VFVSLKVWCEELRLLKLNYAYCRLRLFEFYCVLGKIHPYSFRHKWEDCWSRYWNMYAKKLHVLLCIRWKCFACDALQYVLRLMICFHLIFFVVVFAAFSRVKHTDRAYSKRVPRTNCALRIKKCAPRISSGIYFLSTSYLTNNVVCSNLLLLWIELVHYIIHKLLKLCTPKNSLE